MSENESKKTSNKVNLKKREHAERYPEHQKLQAVANESHMIGRFLDYLEEHGVRFARYNRSEELDEICQRKEEILADYFEINLVKIEDEKRSMLEECRQLNEKR